MIFYLVPAANGEPQRLEGTQADANRVAKDRGLKVRAPQMQLDVPTDKAGLQAYINALMAIEVAAPAPLRGPPFEPIAEMDDHGQPVEDPLGDSCDYGVTPIRDHKPAFNQAQVDAMFAGKADGPLPSVDDVCRSIAEMRGAAIGHVTHELTARIETLAKEVAQ